MVTGDIINMIRLQNILYKYFNILNKGNGPRRIKSCLIYIVIACEWVLKLCLIMAENICEEKCRPIFDKQEIE